MEKWREQHCGEAVKISWCRGMKLQSMGSMDGVQHILTAIVVSMFIFLLFFFVKISHEATLGSCHHHYNAEFYSISIVHADCMLSITKKKAPYPEDDSRCWFCKSRHWTCFKTVSHWNSYDWRLNMQTDSKVFLMIQYQWLFSFYSI